MGHEPLMLNDVHCETYFMWSTIVSNKQYAKVKAESKLCLQEVIRLLRRA